LNRGLRRPLIALVITVAVVGAWVGAPLMAAPAEPLDVGGSPAVAVAGVGPSPRASTDGSPRPATASPAASPLARNGASGSPNATATQVPPDSVVTSTVTAPTAGIAGTAPVLRHGVASATPMLRAALDARLERLRAKYGVPGISASIVFADGSVWHGAAGMADVAAKRRVTDDTAFPVASVSKTFTAALILSLAGDGRLDLDTSVRSYLPTLGISRAITVRQLLDHTSGLRDFYFHPRIDKALLTKPAEVWDAARSLTFVGKPYGKPGTTWHYSNTNYLILGLVAEAVGDGSVAAQLRERFLTPLGLDRTFYQAVEGPRGPLVRNYRFVGTDPKLPAIDLSDGSSIAPFTSVVTAAGAAGSIASTSGDLARWARALYGGAALAPAARAEMIGDVVRTAPYKPTVAYGLGVQSVRIAGHPTLGHSGRFLGARSVIRWLTDEHVAIAVVTNQSRTDTNVLLADLLKLSLRPQPDCISCPAIP
jgi:CubicO group peptidase (beta-lactamase class C family)